MPLLKGLNAKTPGLVKDLANAGLGAGAGVLENKFLYDPLAKDIQGDASAESSAVGSHVSPLLGALSGFGARRNPGLIAGSYIPKMLALSGTEAGVQGVKGFMKDAPRRQRTAELNQQAAADSKTTAHTQLETAKQDQAAKGNWSNQDKIMAALAAAGIGAAGLYGYNSLKGKPKAKKTTSEVLKGDPSERRRQKLRIDVPADSLPPEFFKSLIDADGRSHALTTLNTKAAAVRLEFDMDRADILAGIAADLTDLFVKRADSLAPASSIKGLAQRFSNGVGATNTALGLAGSAVGNRVWDGTPMFESDATNTQAPAAGTNSTATAAGTNSVTSTTNTQAAGTGGTQANPTKVTKPITTGTTTPTAASGLFDPANANAVNPFTPTAASSAAAPAHGRNGATGEALTAQYKPAVAQPAVAQPAVAQPAVAQPAAQGHFGTGRGYAATSYLPGGDARKTEMANVAASKANIANGDLGRFDGMVNNANGTQTQIRGGAAQPTYTGADRAANIEQARALPASDPNSLNNVVQRFNGNNGKTQRMDSDGNIRQVGYTPAAQVGEQIGRSAAGGLVVDGNPSLTAQNRPGTMGVTQTGKGPATHVAANTMPSIQATPALTGAARFSGPNAEKMNTAYNGITGNASQDIAQRKGFEKNMNNGSEQWKAPEIGPKSTNPATAAGGMLAAKTGSPATPAPVVAGGATKLSPPPASTGV